MGGTQRSWALVVEDEPAQAKALRRILAQRFRVRLARTRGEALAALAETRPLHLVLTAVHLQSEGLRGRRAGIDVLDVAATAHPCALRAAMATDDDLVMARAVGARGAVVIVKPVMKDSLRPLLDRATAYPIRAPALAAHVLGLIRAHRLTNTEGAVLCWLVQGLAREQFCEEHAMKAATFKWHVHGLLNTLGDGRLYYHVVRTRSMSSARRVPVPGAAPPEVRATSKRSTDG